MIFDPTTADHLKPWLTRTLEPICDADPEALADYILALLKHNAPENELRKELGLQLEEFLEKEGPPFIDTLFTALRTKSYLPYGTSSASSPPSQPSADIGIPIPLDALISPNIPGSPERSRKRTMEYDDRDGRPVKGARLNQDGQFSRYGHATNGRGHHDNWSNGNWARGDRGRRDGVGPGMGMDGGMDMGMGMGVGMGMSMGGGMNGGMNNGMNGGMGMNGRQQYKPPETKRGTCRDYHNNGYCARGSFCKFSHGDDAFVPGQLFPMQGQPMQGNMFMPIFPNGGMPFGGMRGGPAAAYDPHEARMDMRPPGNMDMGIHPSRPPVVPRARAENGDSQALHQPSGELPVIQDLTPRDPNQEHSPQPNGSSSGGLIPNKDVAMNGTSEPVPGPVRESMTMDVDSKPGGLMGPPQPPQRGYRPMRGGRGVGRPGFFSGDVQSFRPERRNDKTLVVEKIPEDKLTLDTVNGWFKRFGTVTNVAIDASSAKALVSFATHEEAHAAWKSEDAVFNNRFVKLFWHRPMQGHGQVGQRMLAASAPLVANISARENPPPASTSAQAPTATATEPAVPSTPAAVTPAPVHTRKQPTSGATVSALAAKQQLLEQQIAEQKSLMEKLGTASPEEKKEILARLRKLGEEMKPPSTPTPPPASATATSNRRASSTPRADDHEQKERQRLDKELELHSAVHAADGDGESTEALKAKLAKLKAEAASLGIEPGFEAPYNSSYRPYRGRGRGGRSYYRGAMRGGPPRASMKLDNRPKKLLVKDVSADSVQAVRDWYETTGQVDSVDTLDSGDIIVSFKSRSAAEQGLAKGTNIPIAGHKQIVWYSGATTGQPATQKTSSNVTSSSEFREDRRDDNDSAFGVDSHEIGHHMMMGEDDMGVSGWGGDGDGEDGMGML